MNPHDPLKRPGAYLVAQKLGVERPWELSDNRPLRDPLGLVGKMVAAAARDVDELHADLARAADSAIALRTPIAQGDHSTLHGRHGILQTTGPRLSCWLPGGRGLRAAHPFRLRLPSPPARTGRGESLDDGRTGPEQGRGSEPWPRR
jgi:hypothetical protein